MRPSMVNAAGSMRLAGMMLPAKGWRPEPSAFPVLGSKTQPATGFEPQPPEPMAAERLALPPESKMAAGLITVVVLLASCRRLVASQSAKKKSLFFLMGPPTAPPYWFRMYLGFRNP